MVGEVFDRRAEVLFDALVVAGDSGLTRAALFDALVAAGEATVDMDHQVVNSTVTHLRNLLASTGDMEPTEVITCHRASHLSTYRLAMSTEDARRYRLTRAGHIVAELETLVRQVETERVRFAGQEVFTEAAVDYFRNGIRELHRAAAMQLS